MTRSCCRTCRLRFSAATAAELTACPFCDQPLEQLPAATTMGFRLLAVDALAADDAAVERAAARTRPPRPPE
jgi:hypothetical protein